MQVISPLVRMTRSVANARAARATETIEMTLNRHQVDLLRAYAVLNAEFTKPVILRDPVIISNAEHAIENMHIALETLRRQHLDRIHEAAAAPGGVITLDDSSTLLNTLMSLPLLPFKKSFLVPLRLTAAETDLREIARDREPIVRMLLDFLWQNYRQHTQAGTVWEPVISINGLDGMGTSSMLDLLSNLSPVCIREWSPATASHAFSSDVATSVCVVIDFLHVHAPLDHESFEPLTAFALRMLHSYFVADTMSFGSFCEDLAYHASFNDIKPDMAAQMILAHRIDVLKLPASRLMLLVDGFPSYFIVSLFRSSTTFHVKDLLQLLSGHLVFLTGLDRVSEPGQLGIVSHINLPPISGEWAFYHVRLFRANQVVRRIVKALNGYPRAVAMLKHLLITVFEPSTRLENEEQFISDIEPTMSRLYTGIGLPPSLLVEVGLPQSVVVAALLGLEIDRASYLTTEVDHYMTLGFIARNKKAKFVPHISPFWLKIAVRQAVYRKTPLISLLVDQILTELVLLFGKFLDMIDRFHALFEVLRFKIISGPENHGLDCTLQHLYPGGVAAPFCAWIIQIPVRIQARSVVVLSRSEVLLTRSWCRYYQHCVVVVKGGAMDTMMPVGEDCILFLDFKTCLNSAGRVSAYPGVEAALFDKRASLDRRMSRICYYDRPSHSILISASMRPHAIDHCSLPHSTIVLDRSAMLALYGPTLLGWYYVDSNFQ